MFARFFIDRPIFAWVVSLVILLGGGVAYFFLPTEVYPNITPPTVQVTASYPGANAVVVSNTIAAPIEQQVNGVERMLYMSSQSTNDGNYALVVTFEIGTDVNIAQVLVQNRVALALPQLPQQVQLEGVNTKKSSPQILLAINLLSPDRRYDSVYMSNFATIQLKDELLRIKGVGDIQLLGERDYSMRLWLDPYKLATRGLTAPDVINAIQSQNVQVAAGTVGQQPVPAGQPFQLTMSALGRLDTERQFGDIILKTGVPSSLQGDPSATSSTGLSSPVVYVRDVARVELGAQTYDQTGVADGQPSAGMGVFLLPGANALEVANAIKQRMKELKSRFPPGLEYDFYYDTTPFIQRSIDEVLNTLVIAILLVGAVVLFFLQDWKAMILPMIDVPVSLVGTFAVMAALGFSLNNLTLFGLVLAIGIVVDDAIMVLENIERLMATGLDARTATIKAMDELTGPIVAITLVLSSVFLPSCFIPGLTGQFYRQFALTIAASVIISAVNALTLTPSRAVSIFGREEGRGMRDEGGTSHPSSLSPHPPKEARKDGDGSVKDEGSTSSSPVHPSSLTPHPSKEALPWWIFGIAGGLLTAWLAPHFLAGHLGLPAAPAENASSQQKWLYLGVAFSPGLLIGLVAGWFLIGPVNAVLRWIFGGFNRLFDGITAAYGWTVGKLLRGSVIVLVVYAGLLALTWWRVTSAPTSFIPVQDQGYLLINVQLPDSASVQRTDAIMAKIDKIARKIPGVAHTVGVSGEAFLTTTNGPNLATMFLSLKPFEERTREEYDEVIAAKVQQQCNQEIEGAMIGVFRAPPIQGLGNAGGFKLQTEQRGYVDLSGLQTMTDQLVQRASTDPHYAVVFTLYRAHTPQLFVDIDRAKVQSLQVPIQDVFTTLQVYMGGYYVNQFNKFGRTWQVNIQADPESRTSPNILKQLYVRSTPSQGPGQGQMVPLGTLLRAENSTGPLSVMRYNMYTSAAVNGVPAPGVSSGTVVEEMTKLAGELDVPFEWTEMTFLQVQAGNIAMLIFGLGTVLVYLVLAAKYESWRLPLAVILVVPMCLLAAVTGMAIASLPIDIFVQIGFLVLVALACKNAILIVEFAQEQRQQGKGLQEAAEQAARIRFRPIVMTSLAFIGGVFPLVVATGAGAEMRQSLGTAVFSGMIGVAVFGIFLTPVFFFVLQSIGSRKQAGPPPVSPAAGSNGAAAGTAIIPAEAV
ncbi:MAG TPA: efflux RND transporter permease subunit [Gemmataceae bacterium]|jgi:multidrug efflux pump|nr:efflux RND transporter permease subunit [Gemmataceae bacterium]